MLGLRGIYEQRADPAVVPLPEVRPDPALLPSGRLLSFDAAHIWRDPYKAWGVCSAGVRLARSGVVRRDRRRYRSPEERHTLSSGEVHPGAELCGDPLPLRPAPTRFGVSVSPPRPRRRAHSGGAPRKEERRVAHHCGLVFIPLNGFEKPRRLKGRAGRPLRWTSALSPDPLHTWLADGGSGEGRESSPLSQRAMSARAAGDRRLAVVDDVATHVCVRDRHGSVVVEDAPAVGRAVADDLAVTHGEGAAE